MPRQEPHLPPGGSSDRGRGGLISPAARPDSGAGQVVSRSGGPNVTTTITTTTVQLQVRLQAPRPKIEDTRRSSSQAYKKLYGKLKLETLMLNLMMMHLEERRREGKRRRKNVMSSEYSHTCHVTGACTVLLSAFECVVHTVHSAMLG